ncbi:MAG: hypothetical protein ACLUVG_06860 [Phocaeicola vulgatus]
MYEDYSKWNFRAGGEAKVALGLKLSASVSGYNTDKTGNNVQTNLSRGPWGNSSASRDYAMLNHMPKYIPWETSIYDEVTGKNRSYYVSPWAGPQILDTKPDSSVSGISCMELFCRRGIRCKKVQ